MVALLSTLAFSTLALGAVVLLAAVLSVLGPKPRKPPCPSTPFTEDFSSPTQGTRSSGDLCLPPSPSASRSWPEGPSLQEIATASLSLRPTPSASLPQSSTSLDATTPCPWPFQAHPSYPAEELFQMSESRLFDLARDLWAYGHVSNKSYSKVWIIRREMTPAELCDRVLASHPLRREVSEWFITHRLAHRRLDFHTVLVSVVFTLQCFPVGALDSPKLRRIKPSNFTSSPKQLT